MKKNEYPGNKVSLPGLSRLLFLCAGICLCVYVNAQDESLQQLQDRVSRLEQKASRLDTVIKRIESAGLPMTRNDIENQRTRGFVITDIKGISLKIGGFVQADFIYDTKEMLNRDAFQPSSITVPTSNNGGTAFSIRQSRINFLATGSIGTSSFTALLEFDMWGPNGTSGPRIRHAWISIGKFGFGQYWSNFADSDNWPDLMDFWGPNAYVRSRDVQLRFTQKLDTKSTVSFSIEQPVADMTLPADSVNWSTRTLYPDVTASYTFVWDNNKSHLKLSGLLHPIVYRGTGDKSTTLIGRAFNISGKVHTFGNDALKFQIAYGSGYARYNEDLSGLGYDAMPDPSDGYKLKTSGQLYIWAFYDHWWSKKWSSTVGWGNIMVDKKNYLPSTTINRTNYGAVNLHWYPNDYFKIGLEALYGNRINMNGEKGEDLRVQFSAFITL